MFNLDRVVIYECEGCSRNNMGECDVFYSPEAKFRTGHCKSCGLATHIKDVKVVDEGKKRLGQQKQKKKK